MRRHGVCLACVMVSLITVCSTRRGECQSPSDRTAAEALFEEGKRLLADKKFADACARFEASQKLDPGVGTLLFLGDCYETVGRTASAWSTFREAASVARAAGQTDREKVARERAARLEQGLFKLTMTASAQVAAIPGITLRRDGATVSQDLWGVAVPLDPGTYRVEATAPGKLPWSTTVEAPAGRGARVLEIPMLRDAPTPPPPPLAVEHTRDGARSAAAPPAATPPDRWPAVRIFGLTTGILGLAGLGAGAVLGGLTTSSVAEVKERCPDVACSDRETVRRSHTAATMADVTTGLLVGGGAAFAVGLSLFLAGSTTEKAPAAAAWVSPAASPGSIGVLGGGSF